MEHIIKRWVDALLVRLGFAPEAGAEQWAAFLLMVVLALLFYLVCRLLLVGGMRHIVSRTRVEWDDVLFSGHVMGRLCQLAAVILLYSVTPAVLIGHDAERLTLRVLEILMVVAFFRLVNALIGAAFHIVSHRPAWQNKPIKGLRQTAQGIVAIICVILIVSILLDKSPAFLLTGLGASAAVIMLIFRDSILGFVSGIQLSANDMLQVGDWIAMPKYGADGRVEEVSLTTVKIRNWDNTIVTLPPYLLVSDSFQNWRGMQQSGGRRVMRSVNIDMTSVRFCTPEMLARYREIDLLRDYIDSTQQRVEEYNAAHGIAPGSWKINGLHQTNLGVFRAYLERYLRAEVPVNRGMTLMVRQLQPTETGLPMQLYFFTDTVEWVTYERIQSDVFDHVLAVIPEFGLRVFQSPAGSDIGRLGEEVSHAREESAENSSAPAGDEPLGS
jgi:miniconductance mechanosensitive channel